MLAIKSALAAHDAIPLLVFDEIDTNVGGEIAHAVGAKMQTLGRDHQVICITHLPQVAATASSHFVVTKDVTRGRTFSNLHEVTGKARQEEIARMLGGKSDSALKLAASFTKGAALIYRGYAVAASLWDACASPEGDGYKFHLRDLRVLRGGKLLHHGTERQDDFAVEFVEHLREAGVDRGESAENSFVAGELFETRTCVNEIANRQEKEKNRQRTENDLPGNMQTQRANEHHCGEQTPHEKISRHRSVVGSRGPS